MEPETILQNQIIVALNREGFFAVNHTVGQFLTKYGGTVRVGVPGEADIWGVTPQGRAFFIEVKLPGEKPRENQYKFLEAMRKQGAIAGWATSVKGALDIVYERGSNEGA